VHTAPGTLFPAGDAGPLESPGKLGPPAPPATPAAAARRARDDVWARTRAAPLLIVPTLCLVIVALAAHHASFLSPAATPSRYPAWMAGPLAGLWPGAVPGTRALEWLLSATLGLMCVAWVLSVRAAPRLHPGWVLGSILVVHLIFLLAPPLQYTDVFNYINYARMGVVHHLNPYTTLPLAEPHSDATFTISNWHYLRSPYGPLFTLLTYALVPLGVPVSLWAIKLIVGACSLGVLALVWRTARLLGRSPSLAVAFVGLNPIVLVWGLGGEHNDFVMVLLAFAGIYLLLAARVRSGPRHAPVAGHELLAGALLVGAVGVKASAVIFIPVAIAVACRRARLLAGMAAAAALLAVVTLMAFGAHLGGLGTQSVLVSPEGLPNLLGLLLGAGGETSALRWALTGLAALVILFAASRAWRRPIGTMEYACVCAAALVFTLGWSAPWYVLWALPFAALAANIRWQALIVGYTVYALLAWGPNLTDLERSLHFYPRSDALGREHMRQFDQLAEQ